MALIAPTVEAIGDAALTNSIIDRSITELQDSAIEEIYTYAFVGCQSLKKVVFESVTNVQTYAFENCAALTMADFHQPVTLNNYAFSKCSALAALILRGDTLSVRKTLSALTNTPIASGTGYIYVPAVLVDSYKSSTDWSTYANQIRAIEDYPEVCDPYSWEAVAKAIDNGTYKDVYKIGDTVPVDLGSEGIINMQIAAFDADTLADGSGTAAISWVAKELLATKCASGIVWESSPVRVHLQNTVSPLVPKEASDIIVSVQKKHKDTVSGTLQTATTTDDLWVPCSQEIDNSNSGVVQNEQVGAAWYSIFPDNASRVRTLNGVKTEWWLRGAASNSKNYPRAVATYGGLKYNAAYTLIGVCLGFCTGRTPA